LPGIKAGTLKFNNAVNHHLTHVDRRHIMTRRSYRPERIAMLAIGMLAAASLVPARADHQIYPPGWNTPATATAPVLYQFVAGGSRLHRAPLGAIAPTWSRASVGQSAASGSNSSQTQ
jgi:hypothetical protein